MNLRSAATLFLAAVLGAGTALSQGLPWNEFARDPQHSAQSLTASQSLQQILWHTPVDLDPQYTASGELLIHYGSPLITAANTVIVPVKTGAQGGFEVEGLNATNGTALWTFASDYILPPHDWVPVFGPALTSLPQLYFPGAGGTVFSVSSPDSANASATRLAFYGIDNYNSAAATYNQNVIINTPITTDASGNLYFGFLVSGATPVTLQSGIARINSSGAGTWIAASTAANDSSITEVAYNCAPAISPDGAALYVAVTNGSNSYLVKLDSATLSPLAAVPLTDPKSGENSWLSSDSSASPTVGPDGDVYFGVLEEPFPENNDRGWLLHFDSTLTQTKTPGAFGWDDTPSIVSASAVPSYTGASSYLLMSKYNNYANIGTGNGENKIAILDPEATETDPITGVTVMNEVLTILGPTPNPPLPGVKEWCINSAAVDVTNKAVLANSEDGKLYRWDLTTNTFSESVVLTAGLGEAYTPTAIGVDGTVYAINNATLFAVGVTPPVPPAITSAASTTFTVGTAGSFTVNATGAPAPSISETGALPSGVTFTGDVLSGIPAAGTAGSYPITFIASNGVLPNATQNFTLTVSVAPAPDFTLNTLPPVTISSPGASSTPVTLTVTAENGYAGTINFSSSSCSISPAGSESSCSFNPSSVTGSGSTQVTINTTAPQNAGLPPQARPGSSRRPTAQLVGVLAGLLSWDTFPRAALLLTAFLWFLFPASLKRIRRPRQIFAALLLFICIACSGCGSNSGSESTGTTNSGTPVGVTFTVTITATANGGAPSHTTSFTFVVQ